MNFYKTFLFSFLFIFAKKNMKSVPMNCLVMEEATKVVNWTVWYGGFCQWCSFWMFVETSESVVATWMLRYWKLCERQKFWNFRQDVIYWQTHSIFEIKKRKEKFSIQLLKPSLFLPTSNEIPMWQQASRLTQ